MASERRDTVETVMSAAIDDIRERLRSSLNEIAGEIRDPRPRPQKLKVQLPKPSRQLLELTKKGIPVPVLDAKASRRTDGRRIPLALALVRDAQGRSRPGIAVRLLSPEGAVLDIGTTAPNGAVLLRFPRRSDPKADVKGVVDVVGHAQVEVSVPGGRQIDIVDVTVDPLPAAPDAGRLDGERLTASIREELEKALALHDPEVGDGASAPLEPRALAAKASDAAATVLERQLAALFATAPAGDLFRRLPSDFSTEVCEAVAKITADNPDPLLGESLIASRPDPLLGGLAGPAAALTRRTTKVVRTTLVRLAPPDGGTVSPTGAEPARYLVRVRQRWVFAGYSLGELADVEGLDPGATLREVTQVVRRTLETAERATDEQVRRTTSALVSQLQRVSSVDNVVRVAASADTHQRTQALTNVGTDPGAMAVGAVIGGILAGPFGALAGGALGAMAGGAEVGTGAEIDVSARSSVTTTTNLDTSLQVNQLTQSATSLLNRVVRSATAVANQLERTTGTATDRVSPLLSRATNLMRWTVYENYIVCNEVEDVQRIFDVPLVEDLGNPEAPPIFTADDVLEYRRLWEPRLLDPSLRGNFDAIRKAIEQRDTIRKVSRITFRVDYLAVGFDGILRFSLGATEVSVRLRPGDTTAVGTLRIPPTPRNELDQALLSLTAVEPRPDLSLFDFLTNNVGSVKVKTLRLWYDRSPAADQDQFFGALGLAVDADGELAVSRNLNLIVPEDTADPESDPLVKHVNRNRSHYLGLLGRAALADPALRDDARHLAAFGSPGATGGDAAIWRLPIVGFEGARVLVVAPPEPGDKFVDRLLEEDGAGTLVQLAAPGSYAEALQGLTELLDAKGLLHPALLAPPSPLLMPAALVDAANKQLVPLGGGIIPVPGTSNLQQPAGVAEGVITRPLSGVNVDGAPTP